MLSTITANLTVDNGYWLYYGEADGSGLVQVGSDSPSRTGWQWSEEYTFHAPADNYIYVEAANQDQVKMFIGSFEIDDRLVATNTTDWEVFAGTIGQISGATWLHPQVSAPQSPPGPPVVWGSFVPAIDASAEFIWLNTFEFSSADNTVVFRTPINGIDIEMESAELQDATTIEFTYRTSGGPGPFEVEVYLSTDATFDENDVWTGDSKVITPSGGEETTTIDLEALAVSPMHRYILVVADPSKTTDDSDDRNNVASIHKQLIGVVTHGFNLFGGLDLLGGVPGWVNEMAASLEAQGYDDAIPFDWAEFSNNPSSGITESQGERLADEIRNKATAFGGPIDVHMIGHSRGAVVINEAAKLLSEADLGFGSLQLSLLDPHPARNQNPPHYDLNPAFKLLGWLFEKVILDFQAAANDPPVEVPNNVSNVDVYYQRTPSVFLPPSSLPPSLNYFDYVLNLWGELPTINSAQTRIDAFEDISDLFLGHQKVPDWYQENIVPDLGSRPPPPAEGEDGGITSELELFCPDFVTDITVAQEILDLLGMAKDAYDHGELNQCAFSLRNLVAYLYSQQRELFAPGVFEILAGAASLFAQSVLESPVADFGDAPDSYQTRLARNGPSHLDAGPTLGMGRDTETEGQPVGRDDSLGLDDEDGVTFPSPYLASRGITTPGSLVVTASALAKLDAWIDFNSNGIFDDATERITAVNGTPLNAGDNEFSFTIPAGTVVGTTYARFRLSSGGSLLPTGPAVDGEVEDYAVEFLAAPNIAPTAVDDAISTSEGDAVVISVLANDSDLDGTLDGSSVTLVSPPLHGTTEVEPPTSTLLDVNDDGSPVGDSFASALSGTVDSSGRINLSVSGYADFGFEGFHTQFGDYALFVRLDVEDFSSFDPALFDFEYSGTLRDEVVNPYSITGLTPGTPFIAWLDNTIGSEFPDTVLGVFEVTAGGSILYTPDAGFTGTDTFTYTVQDDTGDVSNEATVTIVVVPNQPPVAVDDLTATKENEAVVIEVLLNDSDPDGTLEAISVTVISPPANGTVVIDRQQVMMDFDNDGSPVGNGLASGIGGTVGFLGQIDLAVSGYFDFSFTGEHDQSGEFSLFIRLGESDFPDDGGGGVFARNGFDPDVFDFQFHGNLTAGEVEWFNVPGLPAGTPFIAWIDNLVSPEEPDTVMGWFENTSDGTITYTPDPGFIGTDVFSYTVQDNDGSASNVATVTVVVSQNHPPIAIDDGGSGFATDKFTDFTTGDVLANDSDPDIGDTVTVESLDTEGTLGLVTNYGDGTFRYSTNGQFDFLPAGVTATDTFRYTISDGHGGTDTATVTITITGVEGFHDPFEGTSLHPFWETQATSGFITFPSTANPHGGSQSVQFNTVDDDFFDKDVRLDHSFPQPAYGRFSVWVYDSGANRFEGNYISMTVTGSPNYASIGVYDYNFGDGATYQTGTQEGNFDSGIGRTQAWHLFVIETTETATTLWVDGVQVTTGPGMSVDVVSLRMSAPGWRPPLVSYFDDFTFVAAVLTSNQPPLATGDNGLGFITDENALLTTASVLVNDSDPDAGDVLTVQSIDTTGTLGVVTNNGDGTFGYEPNGQFEALSAGATATDSFSYTISDGNGGTSTATVTMTIRGENDGPQVTVDGNEFAGNEGASFSLAMSASDPDLGDVLSYSLDSPPSGAAIDAETGLFTWVPDDGLATVTIIVRVTDNGSPSLSDTTTVTISIANVPPTASLSGPDSGIRRQVHTFLLGATDTSPLGQAAGFSYAVDWGDGTTAAVPRAPGNGASFSLSHAFDLTGTYMVRVTATDQDGGVSAVTEHLFAAQPVPLDVNDDLTISPIDVLLVINYMNKYGSRPFSLSSPPGPPYLDVNRDGWVSPIDALQVLNFLNGSLADEGEGEAGGDDLGGPLRSAVSSEKPGFIAANQVPNDLIALLAQDLAEQDLRRKRIISMRE